MTELELGKELERICEENNILYHHCRDSRNCAGVNGLPDYLLVGRRHIMFVELKNWGQLRPGQKLWKQRLEAANQQHVVWTPYELKTGEIQETLAWL